MRRLAAVFNKEQLGSLANLSRWAFLLTFAGVGLRTNIRELKAQGIRPFAVGAIGEATIALVTLRMVVVAVKAFNL
ncbi:MAG TPA: putative sulfate exporter family transporter [Terriglobales bacterium]